MYAIRCMAKQNDNYRMDVENLGAKKVFDTYNR